MFVGLLGLWIFGGSLMHGLMSFASAILAGLYLIYDIKLILGNDRRKI